MRLFNSLHHRLPLITLILTNSISTNAQFIVDSLSFGHSDPLSPTGRAIPNWRWSADDFEPTVLSDRIVLTPPYPGNKRAGLSSEHTLTYPEWTLDVEFRASGPERGSGNMQVWLTKDQPQVASVYTAERFEGLVLELDQYGGSGGSLRGFLNDGSTSYRGHHNVDGLAFGHCDYSYRNLGRMSKLRVKLDSSGLDVSVDDRTCFKSGQIQIPQGYYLGVSAASAESPDSFEINKFVVSTTTSVTRDEPRRDQPQQQQQQSPQTEATHPPPASELHGVQPEQQQQQQPPPPPPPSPAQQQQQQQQPLNDANHQVLLSRLDALTSTLTHLQETLTSQTTHTQTWESDLLSLIHQLSTTLTATTNSLSALTRKHDALATTLSKLVADVEGRDYREHLTGLQLALRDTQDKLMSGLGESVSQITKSGPRIGLVVGCLVAVQLGLAAGYVVYKRRRARSPKKLL